MTIALFVIKPLLKLHLIVTTALVINLSFGFFCPLDCVKASRLKKFLKGNINKYDP